MHPQKWDPMDRLLSHTLEVDSYKVLDQYAKRSALNLQFEISKVQKTFTCENIRRQSTETSLSTLQSPDSCSARCKRASQRVDIQEVMECLTANFSAILFLDARAKFFCLG